MNGWQLAIRSLRYYWRGQLAVAAGAAVAAAVLVGALVVGDSVRYTLRHMAEARLGNAQFALQSGDRYFRDALTEKITPDTETTVVPVIIQNATAARPDGAARVNRVQLMGVTPSFFDLSPNGPLESPPMSDGVALNEALAEQLNVEVGDTVVLRVTKPSSLPRDVPLTSEADAVAALRVKVDTILMDDDFGRFSLRAEQSPPFNAFIALDKLQAALDLDGRANTIVLGMSNVTVDGNTTVSSLDEAIAASMTLDDAEVALRKSPDGRSIEIVSRRIFIDPAIDDAVRTAMKTNAKVSASDPMGVFTYFVNDIQHGERLTPYSMVAGVGFVDGGAHQGGNAGTTGAIASLKEDEAIINSWLAEDLEAKPGDTIVLRYFSINAGRQLVEKTASFTVKDVISIEGLAADRTLMPAFPGIAEADSSRDWDEEIPGVDLGRIRDKDEKYWEDYRGTPKVFISLSAAQEMWGNRFGRLTAVRFDASAVTQEQLREALLKEINPQSVGLVFEDVQSAAAKAQQQGTGSYFGGLFVGLSFFIIVAAALLTGLLFVFGVEQRSEQVGLMLAVGLRPRMVQGLLLREGLMVAAVGSLAGAVLGLVYTVVVLAALSSIWSGAVAGGAIKWHASIGSVIGGAFIALIISALAMRWTLGRLSKHQARELLSFTGGDLVSDARKSRWPWLQPALMNACFVAAVGLVVTATGQSGQAMTMSFFGCGALLLIAGILAARSWLMRLGRRVSSARAAKMTVSRLGMRSMIRRRGRSLAVIALLACGVFLVVAIQANRLNTNFDPTDRSSGTGGFTLFVETQIPILRELNNVLHDPKQRNEFGLDDKVFDDVQFVSLRVKRGDDASCLNLNQAQTPQLLGAPTSVLKSRGAFDMIDTLRIKSGEGEAEVEQPDGWEVLDASFSGDAVPVVGDKSSLMFALKVGLGDRLTYLDERGQSFDVVIAGIIDDSILQGNLVMAEDHFMEKYPSTPGYAMFLVDAPRKRHEAIAKELSHALELSGAEVTSTRVRLARFQSVTNTYLSIFLALGGLGLVLGSVGLGIVVLRNALERRGEFALMRAVGFEKTALRKMLFIEHAALLALGLIIGVGAAAVAVAPAIDALGRSIVSTAVLILLVSASGLLWVWLASFMAMRGELMDALRED